MRQIDAGYPGAGKVSPYEGEVLFCDRKKQEDRQMVQMLDHKGVLITTWYEGKHGLNNVNFRTNQRGTMHYMRFGFYSADMAATVRTQHLAGRRNYEADHQLAISLVRKKLPARVTEIVQQFLPDYID